MKRLAVKGCGIVLFAIFFLAVAGFVGDLFGGTDGDVPPSPSVTGQSTVTPSSAPATPHAPSPLDDSQVTLVEVVDGDTIRTSEGLVRIIGIDTPERGECGYFAAANEIEQVIAVGDPVILELPAGQNGRDRHGRPLRYVLTDTGIDIGMMQLEAGHAVARYDSTDGYPSHPKEADYHSAQIATLGADGAVISSACEGIAAVPSPDDSGSEPSDEQWWIQYGSCAQLKRNDVGHPTGPFSRDDPAEADIHNWFASGTGHRGDGDGDGLACE